jgi:hypothetical protein
MQRHHGENPDIVGTLDVENTVGKFLSEMTADGRVDHAKSAGYLAGIGDQAIDDVIKALTKSEVDAGVVFRGFLVFRSGLGMEDVRLH